MITREFVITLVDIMSVTSKMFLKFLCVDAFF